MRNANISRSLSLALLAATGALATNQVLAQPADIAKLAQATAVLEVFTVDDEHGIPTDILQRARGVAVIPSLIRGGFFIGGRRGRGVLAIRSPNGDWSNPAFITITGGSIGWQLGAESADVVLVFANERAVRNIASGKFTLGGDAAAVAGPVGRRTTAAVTGRAEIYVYMHSKGLFAGAAFEGTRLDVDQKASAAFYPIDSGAKPLGEQGYGTPPSALRFLDALSRAAAAAPPAPAVPVPSRQSRAGETEEAVTFPLDGAPLQ